MNVLIIMTDQQRADTIGFRINTPNLSKLASQSICFNAFAQSPQCQPARAAFWTGRYPSTLGMWWNEMSLPRSERTLANVMRDLKYETGYFGKWHLDKDVSTLDHFGFDPKNSYLMEDWREGKDLPTKDAGIARREYLEIMKTKPWASKLRNRLYQHEDVIAEKAVKFMSNTKNFLCAIGFRGPHPPYTSPPPYCDMYDPADFDVPDGGEMYDGSKLDADDWRLIKSQYYGNISWIDDNIGRILDYVDRKAPETIVVFTSDHGDMLGDHGQFSKGLYAYDPIVKVPLMIRSPGIVKNKNDGYLAQHIDVMPTIMDLLALNPSPGVQGKSLVQPGREVNRFVLSMMGYNPRLKMIRDKRYKYWTYDGQEYLFDLKIDPGETENLAFRNDPYDIIHEFRYNLINCLIQAEDPLPIPDQL